MCPHDRPLTVPRYILSISLLPAQGFSRRNLPSYPTSCPKPFSVGGRTGAGLPAAGTAGGAMLGHTSRGTACTRACWKHLLEHAAPLALGFPGKPWLPALQLECAAISGSPPGRGGPGDRVNLSVQLLPFGKKGKSQAQPGLTCPMQQSSLSQEPELPQAWGHRRLPTKTCSGHIPHLPGTPKPVLAQASAGQLTAPCNTRRVRTESQALHWCPEKPASASAPSY